MPTRIPITVAKGDGIGPEIMDATLRILDEAKADLEYRFIEIGESVYLKGITSGIEPTAWDSLRDTKVFLKAPITTPQGGGYKSLNVTIRKSLSLYANVRPCVSYSPYVYTKHPKMNTVIIRENEEDLYAGIEHQQTDEVTQCLKLITKPGTERIIRYAFEYARHFGRKKVTCMSKDNIMKITDGLFHQTYDRIAKEYPEIENEHYIIDIGSARLAEDPDRFDVIVTENLYGDIISDIAAEVAGSVGLAGSANIGNHLAMFEAIHGSAPDIAGQNIANPSGLLLGAVQMLVHIGKNDIAEKVHNAWLKTIEDGIHTRDIYNAHDSKELVGTKEFATAVIKRLGEEPKELEPVRYNHEGSMQMPVDQPTVRAKKEVVGCDIFLQWNGKDPKELGDNLGKCKNDPLELIMITNRGVKVYPDGLPETFCTDHWRCRFSSDDLTPVDYKEVLKLMQIINEAGFDIIKTENLCTFDGKPAFSLGQGQ